MKTGKIALLVGIAAIAAAAEPNTAELARAGGGSADRPAGPEAAHPMGILILALGRSGSTMVGELFRQNKDVLYFYEPCRQLNGKSLVGMECLALLQRLAQCTFSLEDSAWMAQDASSLSYGSSALTSLRKASGGKQLAQAHKDLLDTCIQSKAVAVKSIRLSGGLGDKDNNVPGLKVLHLVRDPRGVVRSQQKHFHTLWGAPANADSRTKAYAGGVGVCSSYRHHLDSTKKLESNRYLRVRYEDIATSPKLAVELIYCWSGLGPVPPSVSKWVDINTNMPKCDGGDGGTHRARNLRATTTTEDSSFGYKYTTTTADYVYAGSGDGVNAVVLPGQRASGLPESGAGEAAAAIVSRRTQDSGGDGGGGTHESGESNNNDGHEHIEKKLAECVENTRQTKTNPYGTKRQSAAMASMWRTLMSEQDAQAIWEGCEDSGVMDVLGYDP